MSGGLSDSDIEALVSAVKTGNPTGEGEAAEAPPPAAATPARRRRVRHYDFRRPIKADRDQVRALDRIFNSAGRNAGVRLSSIMRSIVNVDVLRIEQGPWREQLESFPQPAVYTLVSARLKRRPLLVCMETTVLLQMVERLLGGQGNSTSRRSTLSEIEMSLATRVLDVIVETFDEEWRSVDEEDGLELRSIETEQVIANVVPAAEPTVTVSMELTFAGMSAAFCVLLPYTTISRMLERASMGQYDQARSGGADGDASATTRAVRIPLKALVLDEVVPIEHVQQLRVGDRLELRANALDSVTVHAAGSPVFIGGAARRGSRRALRIDRHAGGRIERGTEGSDGLEGAA